MRLKLTVNQPKVVDQLDLLFCSNRLVVHQVHNIHHDAV